MFKYGLLFASLWSFAFGQSQYQIGVGKSDCTGPAAEVNMVSIFVLLFNPFSSEILADFCMANSLI